MADEKRPQGAIWSCKSDLGIGGDGGCGVCSLGHEIGREQDDDEQSGFAHLDFSSGEEERLVVCDVE